ncbi:MAG: M55 family metallopeptidase [Clostridia bacterium]
MNIFIMTDLEGVAGVLNKHSWVLPGTAYYEKAKRLLTEETNAACRGFLKAGATGIVVCDGHGPGGIDPEILHEEASLIRGFPEGYPCGLTNDFDCVAWVGQHAKSNTPNAHLAHTGNHQVWDYTINGLSLGEFGQFALCACMMGVTPVFASGDEALCREAMALLPGMETVAVKKGREPGTGEQWSHEEYDRANDSALHLAPSKARRLIEEGSQKALERWKAHKDSFSMLKMDPPYVKKVWFRASGNAPAYSIKATSLDHIWDVINHPGEKE